MTTSKIPNMGGVETPDLQLLIDSTPGLLAISLVVVLSAQLSIGILNVLLLTPAWLQILHLFVGDVFWIAFVLASADLLLVNAGPDETQAIVDSAVRQAVKIAPSAPTGWSAGRRSGTSG